MTDKKTNMDGLQVLADFLNTYDKRVRFEGDPGRESLNRPEDLADWLLARSLLGAHEKVDEEELGLAIAMRNLMRRTLYGSREAGGDPGAPDELNELLRRFSFSIALEEADAALIPNETGGRAALARLALLLFEARRAGNWHRLRVCSAEDCQWAFADRSRPGTGRWCTMKACGNRSKNKTYRERGARSH
ncbi:CGNR zinc finger domain-containing protein [Saccharibacillus sp. CPCC 101409]|uniref:CGNR zinc finger domain-containing protein n=1 Tax=Saccharibacillus sp. CPCC 101409 TaxID=3058041 RepID=UPI0026714A5F|nr:CGNR zinc finger domain-containing protein [Saccharibacillus sp. CPCC 101409]MDO3412633.1 CGNR zinc finger domain-containing protein [Saccharibacillus sp. CPCC 101409]